VDNPFRLELADAADHVKVAVVEEHGEVIFNGTRANDEVC